ncbi:MAG: CPXCG motif-containing cysteine-rich protein [Pseudoxanthomonas sp.]
MLPFVTLHCPYCGEPQDVAVDDSAGDQQYFEDCQICCKPMWLSVVVEGDTGQVQVHAQSQDG